MPQSEYWVMGNQYSRLTFTSSIVCQCGYAGTVGKYDVTIPVPCICVLSQYQIRKNSLWQQWFNENDLDSKDHGTNLGPIWGRQDPGGPHVGPMKFAIWGCLFSLDLCRFKA